MDKIECVKLCPTAAADNTTEKAVYKKMTFCAKAHHSSFTTASVSWPQGSQQLHAIQLSSNAWGPENTIPPFFNAQVLADFNQAFLKIKWPF